ncbi:hypothetical protein FJZ40_02585 [Candidatus Shapirobacteria bacterium]|nr:hypothetical protein [Candidatus Shapirobacteria bacterium]
MRLIEGGPAAPVEPDQVLGPEELDGLYLDEVLWGCPGYEPSGKLDESNWPPRKRDVISRAVGTIHEVVADVCFRIQHPHAYRAFRDLERQKGR